MTDRAHSNFPEVFGSFEVAEALEIHQSNLFHVKDLPAPVQTIRATRLWLATEIREYAKLYNARRGRMGRHAKRNAGAEKSVTVKPAAKTKAPVSKTPRARGRTPAPTRNRRVSSAQVKAGVGPIPKAAKK